MHDAVADGVGDGWIAEGGVPLVGGELAGDDRGGAVVAVLEDLEQIASALARMNPGLLARTDPP
jgi:hypothetical protein